MAGKGGRGGESLCVCEREIYRDDTQLGFAAATLTMPMPKLVILLSFPSRATTICVTIAWPLTPAAALFDVDDVDAGEATDCSVLQIFCGLLSLSESSPDVTGI